MRGLAVGLIFIGSFLGQATAHAGKAMQLMQDRRYSEAAVEFEKALAADPNDDTVRIQYATCLFAQERNAVAASSDEAADPLANPRQRRLRGEKAQHAAFGLTVAASIAAGSWGRPR